MNLEIERDKNAKSIDRGDSMFNQILQKKPFQSSSSFVSSVGIFQQDATCRDLKCSSESLISLHTFMSINTDCFNTKFRGSTGNSCGDFSTVSRHQLLKGRIFDIGTTTFITTECSRR